MHHDAPATHVVVLTILNGQQRTERIPACDDCSADVDAWAKGKRSPAIGAQPGGRHGKCRSCDAPVLWQKTATGKWTPVDESGEPHWATCPQASLWRNEEKNDG
jgi:hypothetical protein